MKAGRPWDRGTPPSAFLLLALDVLNIGLEIVAYDVLLGRGQPICIGRFVLQNEIDDDAQKRGRQTFHHEQPLPAGQAAEAVHIFQDTSAKRTGDDADDCCRRHEDRDDLTAADRGIPICEIQDNPREEACLEHAEQEPRDVELHRRLHEHHRRGGNPPQHHDAQSVLRAPMRSRRRLLGTSKRK